MAYISFQPSDYFNTLLYTDNGANRTLTGVGFQPDWVWIKTRNHGNSHNIFDAVRGANKNIRSNSTAAEVTTTDTLTAFTSDGFSLGVDASGYGVNYDNKNEVSWNWKANGSGSANTDGSISSTVSASTTSGFSIVKYTGGGANATVGHGLNSAPKMVIVKRLSGSGYQWMVYHKDVGNDKYLNLDDAGGESGSSANYWNNTDPTSSVFSIGVDTAISGSGADIIAYCFAEKKGFSKFGLYAGNANADGSFVYTGFKPAFIMIKKVGGASASWVIFDSKRLGYNVANYQLYPNSTTSYGNNVLLDITSNGFKCRANHADVNGSGATYIFMAFAEEPLVSSNGVPAVAR